MFLVFARLRATLLPILFWFLVPRPIHAAISTLGNVTPDPHSTTSSDDLYIAKTANGAMLVDDGSDVASSYSFVGDDASVNGSAMVSGIGSTLNSDFLYVGNNGMGSLQISNGGQVNSGHAYLSNNLGSTGFATVDGAGSTWNVGGFLNVGGYGTGTLAISHGGTVITKYYYEGIGSSSIATVDGAGSSWTNYGGLYVNGALAITAGGRVDVHDFDNYHDGYVGYGVTGTATVDGSNSAWNMPGTLYLGYYSSIGILNITNGGTVTSGSGILGYDQPGSSGVVTVGGTGSRWMNGGDMYLGYFGNGTLNLMGGGLVDVGGAVHLGYSAAFGGGAGSVNLTGGVLRLHSGSLVKGSGIAAFIFTGGRLEGAGSINLGAPLVQNGGTLAPGNSVGTTTIEGGYTLNAGALEIEINGLGTAGVNWDQLKVNGAVDLLGSNGLADGTLNVLLGFAPSVGSDFLIVDNDGNDAVTGPFANESTLAAAYDDKLYHFAINYAAGTGNDISLTMQFVSLLGDYNGDGIVDAADYVVWRKLDGTQVALNTWRANFGHTFSGSGSAASASEAPGNVPEPAGVWLVAVVALILAPALGRKARPRRRGQAHFAPKTPQNEPVPGRR